MTPRDNHMPTDELRALDAAHHIHPFSDTAQMRARGARVITQAEGVWLTDSEGNRILDGMAGLWCVNIGYGRTELADVAARQMAQLPYYNTFFMTTHPPAVALSAKLAQIAPGDKNRVFYAGSGSEANETNIRLARHYWHLLGHPEKKTIIARKNGYHGSTMGAASLGGMAGMHAQGGMPIPDIVHIDQPHWWAEGGGMSPEEFGLARARQLEEMIDQLGEDKIAAFIAEPIQGAGGVIIPPETYWPEITRICREHHILLIADEVICGFGRTGHWFGTDYYDLDPDIMTIAKGLSSGYQPIGGSIVRESVAQVIEDGGEFNHGYTYSSHPVAAAVALENIRILEEEKVIDRVRSETAPYLQQKWASLADHPMVGEARMAGLMGALELTPEKASRAKFAEEGAVGLMTRERCFANGLVMRHVGDKMIISPPLVISKEEVDRLIELAWQSLDEGMADAREAGAFPA
ncbi:aspartate aminotransferase family protein [Pontivivens insulae]|uniref:Beta-alanine--pyruvate aminotransferase n=1 Tax=Pontivivens insulae TaxID=1639689 RepID=A0A2R8A7A3_9RHOB|nr:aspartate aminotransferase family protein [Pontivivens insulae]RED18221.1 putrescine aminotransferase [Pontivivens insulae]SPF28119.1 Beta-alanine--pyruvate aminotransferase [Pontivivens insulae]